mgnify:CR=1 FL=1
MQGLQASMQQVRAHHRPSAVSFSRIASFGEVCKSLNCFHAVDQICDRSLSVILWSSASKLCLVNALVSSAIKLCRQLPDSSTALFRHVRLLQALPHCLMQAHSLVNIGSVAALATIAWLPNKMPKASCWASPALACGLGSTLRSLENRAHL